MQLLIKMVKKHQEIVTDVAVSTSALAQAVLTRFPELAADYERLRQLSASDSVFARESRRIAAEFDRLTAGLNVDDPP